MIKNNVNRYLWIALVIGLLALVLGPALVQAGPTLPPRDPTATPSPQDKKGDKDKPLGAYIHLQSQIAAAGAWGVVQWQDSDGGWHDVEGWRGPLADGNNWQWWVAAGDFGKGPFRWAITQGQGGALVGVSSPFHLPTGANQTVNVIAVSAK